ncbi:hypothetical protein BGX24_002191 [Mortierella sp. AD032]|nr:hypothetical protein BGX24_002191 [Mortierella sp. AD032]
MHFSKALLLCTAYVACANAISLEYLADWNGATLYGCFSGAGSSPRTYSTVYACKKVDGVLIGSEVIVGI